MEVWSIHQLIEEAKKQNNLSQDNIIELQRYAQNLIKNEVPVIFSLMHLSVITNLDYDFLYKTVSRRFDKSNYRMFSIRKRSGKYRFIHASIKKLHILQKYINQEILKKIPTHPNSYAFKDNCNIVQCAKMHCGCKWLLQFDLKDFFFSITEKEVYNVFKSLGYRDILAFEFARICTTTRLPRSYNVPRNKNINKYKQYEYSLIGVLPQGAATSPALSNLIARKLDEDLQEYAQNFGFVYTRYADDLTFSSVNLPPNLSINTIRQQIIKIIRKNHFTENKDKIRIAGPGAKKLVLGLLVDGNNPRISKEGFKRIEGLLYVIKKFEPQSVAKIKGFDSVYGLMNHLTGLMAYLKDVDIDKYNKIQPLFLEIKSTYSL